MKHDASLGMWCAVCHAFRQHPTVAGSRKKVNALARPTREFRFRNVDTHANSGYHLAAVGLQSRLDTRLSSVAIQLPTHVIPQAKVLFRTVLFMARHGLAHRKLTHLLELQKMNAVKYDLRSSSLHSSRHAFSCSSCSQFFSVALGFCINTSCDDR